MSQHAESVQAFKWSVEGLGLVVMDSHVFLTVRQACFCFLTHKAAIDGDNYEAEFIHMLLFFSQNVLPCICLDGDCVERSMFSTCWGLWIVQAFARCGCAHDYAESVLGHA